MFQRITIIVAAQSRKKGNFVEYLEKFPKQRMVRCNLQDLVSVISGDLEVSFFKNLQSAHTVPPNSNISTKMPFLTGCSRRLKKSGAPGDKTILRLLSVQDKVDVIGIFVTPKV